MRVRVMKVSEATDPVWLPALSPVSYVISYSFFSPITRRAQKTIRDLVSPPPSRFDLLHAVWRMANVQKVT